MLRLATCFVGICLPTASVLAGCTEDVVASWKRLHTSPFSFEMKISDAASAWRISGAVAWPTALHYQLDHPRGNFELLSIGGRQWRFSDGEWRDDTEGRNTFDGRITHVVMMYVYLFGLDPDGLADQIRDAKCLGRVMKNGRELVGYEYSVTKVLIDLVVDRERLFIDPSTGLPVRQELEVCPDRACARMGWLGETEIRVDASLKIEPPRSQ
jgi:hypothetical protein